jgi:hypothetical protein
MNFPHRRAPAEAVVLDCLWLVNRVASGIDEEPGSGPVLGLNHVDEPY